MGPWSRSFVSALVGRTERPSDEAVAEVHDLTVEMGTIQAAVGECTVTLTAERVPSRIWTAMSRFAQGRGPLEEAVAGRAQAVHLEHLMAEDWGEPLIPRANSIARACTCDEAGACDHITALAYAVADAVDADPSLLLRWRGCFANAPEEVAGAPMVAIQAAKAGVDPWRGGALPEPAAARKSPAGVMLKRLGPSGLLVGEVDLADVLSEAYTNLCLNGRDSPAAAG